MPEYSDSNPSSGWLSDDLSNRQPCSSCGAPKGFDPTAGWCRTCGYEPPAGPPEADAAAPEPEAPDMLEEALRWARDGLAVFPVYEAILGPDGVRCACGKAECINIGKHPRTQHGLNDATTDEVQIRAWWTMWPNANIGAPTGDGWFVLDLDGPEAEAWRRARVAEHGPLPATCEITTGRPEGGRHLWFLGDGVRNSSSKLGPKVDTRGEGGYVILPPSLHASGRRYRLSVDAPVAEAPGWLLEDARTATGKPKGKPSPSQGAPGPWGADGEIRKRLDGLVRVVENKIASAPEGTRNDTLNREAFCFGQYLGHYRIDLGEYERRLVNAGITAGLPATEAEATVCGTNGRPGSLAQGCADPKPLADRHPDGDTGDVFSDCSDSSEGVDGWQTPIPLRETHDVPAFPTDALPPVLRRYVEDAAEVNQIPPDLAAMPLLGVLGVALQGKYEVHGPRHVEPLSLWTAVLMPPGSRKSEAIKPCLGVLVDRMKELREDLPAYVAWANKRADLTKQLNNEEDEKAREKIAADLDALGLMFPPEVLFTQDATPERLAEMMMENGGRMGLVAAEGDAVFRLACGAYGNTANLDVYLQGHAGDPLKIDRKRKPGDRVAPSVFLPNPAVSIAVTVQPSVIVDRRPDEARMLRERGMLARFLFAWPASMVGQRRYRGVPPRDQKALDDMRSTLRRLLETPGCRTEDGYVAQALTCDDDATEVYLTWAEEVERLLLEGATLAMMADWGSKLPGATLRLAALLHAAERPATFSRSPVDGEAMERAVKIGRYLIPHARKVYGDAGVSDPAIATAERILSWIRRGNLPGFTLGVVRDVLRGADVLAGLRRLELHGYVRQAQRGTGRPGRPTRRYLVNPFVRGPNNPNNPNNGA